MKKRNILFLFGVLLFSVLSGYWASTNTLSRKLHRITCPKDCRVGIAVMEGREIQHTGNRKYPLMSVFKVFIAAAVLNRTDNEGIDLNTKLTVTREMIYENTYSPMIEKYKAYPYEISIAELLERMVSESDNNACDILLEYIGGIKQLQAYLSNLGFQEIEVSVNEKEMNIDAEKQYLNRAYPADVVRFLKLIREGKILSPEHVDFLNKIMIKTKTGADKLKAGLPENIIIGHKTGSSSRTKEGIKIADNDAGFVILPDGRTYYIAVMVADSEMTDADNAAFISKISAAVYDCFR